MCINVELFCDCIVGVIGPEYILIDGSGVFTKEMKMSIVSLLRKMSFMQQEMRTLASRH